MMDIATRQMKCCGVNEIHGLNYGRFSAKQVIEFLIKTFQYADVANGTDMQKAGAGRAAYVMTLAIDNGYGGAVLLKPEQADKRENALRDYIKRHKLGQLITLPDSGNPNYQNRTIIRTMVFVHDQEGMLEYARKYRLAVPKSKARWRLDFWISTT